MTKEREALKLALEALQKIYIAPEHEEYIQVWWPACEQAITAIKEALAQPEQEPVVGTKTWFEDGKVVTQNLTAKDIYKEPEQREPVAYSGNGTAGREADVKPTGFFFQMPIGEVYGWQGTGKGQPMCRFDASEAEMPVGTKLYTTPPQPEPPPECQTEAEKTAFAFGWFKAMEAQRLAQPEQEPVAWAMLMPVKGDFIDAITPDEHARVEGEYKHPLYTTPPQRKWIGLDFDTIEECFPEGPSVFEDAYGDNHTSPRWLHAFARAIEAKLKEKNT